jgi:hypothetical protein
MHGANRVNGVAMHDAYNQYLAYHEGKAGFARGARITRSAFRPEQSGSWERCPGHLGTGAVFEDAGAYVESRAG